MKMARRDAGTIWSQAQSITALSQASTNYIDFFDPAHQIGQMTKVPYLHVRVNLTFTGLITALNIYFQDAQQAAGSVGPNAIPGVFENTAIQFLNIPKASLVAGNDLIMIPIPITGGLYGLNQASVQPNTLSDSPLQRFTQFLYTCDAIPTVGALDAWIDTL
jgi:hypothetical protein